MVLLFDLSKLRKYTHHKWKVIASTTTDIEWVFGHWSRFSNHFSCGNFWWARMIKRKSLNFRVTSFLCGMSAINVLRACTMYMHTYKTDNCVIFLRSIYILHIIQVFARVLFLFLRWRLWWVVLVAVTDTPRPPIECNQSNWEWWNGSGDNCERWQVAVVDGSNG